jgi:hypothetical protein
MISYKEAGVTALIVIAVLILLRKIPTLGNLVNSI